MCIRDRASRDQSDSFGTGASSWSRYRVCGRSDPVSYTHLDVYKRQVFHDPLVENVGKQVLTFTRDRKMTAQEMRETAGKLLQYVDVENPQAVSYTHLSMLDLVVGA